MSLESSPALVPCAACTETEYLQRLNERFASYVSRVRQVREQGSRVEATNATKMTKVLEEEIVALKSIYEQQLEEVRNKVEEMARERTQHQLIATKNSALVAELKGKLAMETSVRKKIEDALADAQRVIADKEALLQDARVTATQHQNAHMDTKREKDRLQDALTQTQQVLDVEVAAKNDLQTLTNQLNEKLNFQQKLHDQELQEMRYRLDEANNTIAMVETRQEEYNTSDENVSAMLVKVKMQGEAELRRLKEESEIAYENGIKQIRNQLDDASRNLAATRDDNIHLKAQVEAFGSKIIKLEAKCSKLETQKAGLIKNLEMERQQNANTIKNLEAKLREVDETLMAKVRELSLARSAHLPLNLELDALTTLLEAEERRLNLTVESKRPVGPVRRHTCHSTSTEQITTKTLFNGSAKVLGSTHAHHPTVTGTVVLPPGAQLKTASGTLPVDNKVKPVDEPITTANPYRHTWSSVPNFVDYYRPSLSQKDDFWFLEVDPDGNYVRVYNTSSFKDEEIGGYMIQQNIAGRPVRVFRFAPRTWLKALSHATVWSAATLSSHNSPSDFLWIDQHKWETGPECTTILCKPNGQPVAWTTAAVPRKLEGKLFSNLPTDPFHPHTVQPRTKIGGHDTMNMYSQARPQIQKSNSSGASRTGGAPLRKFMGTSLPNSKSVSPKIYQEASIPVLPAVDFSSSSQKHQDRRSQNNG